MAPNSFSSRSRLICNTPPRLDSVPLVSSQQVQKDFPGVTIRELCTVVCPDLNPPFSFPCPRIGQSSCVPGAILIFFLDAIKIFIELLSEKKSHFSEFEIISRIEDRIFAPLEGAFFSPKRNLDPTTNQHLMGFDTFEEQREIISKQKLSLDSCMLLSLTPRSSGHTSSYPTWAWIHASNIFFATSPISCMSRFSPFSYQSLGRPTNPRCSLVTCPLSLSNPYHTSVPETGGPVIFHHICATHRHQDGDGGEPHLPDAIRWADYQYQQSLFSL